MRMVLTQEFVQNPFDHSCLLQCHSSFDSLLSRMHEDHDLVPFADHLRHLFKCNSVQVLSRVRTVRFPSDTYEMLLQRYGPEGGVEIKQANLSVDTQEIANVDVVG